MEAYLKQVEERDGPKGREYRAAILRTQQKGFHKKHATFTMIAKSGEIKEPKSSKVRGIMGPTYEYRAWGGYAQYFLQRLLKYYSWSICGKTPGQVDQ